MNTIKRMKQVTAGKHWVFCPFTIQWLHLNMMKRSGQPNRKTRRGWFEKWQKDLWRLTDTDDY
jgi:hypothetical protein